MEKLHIIGYGPGDETQLTGKAKHVLNTARRILSTGRIGGANERFEGLTLTELLETLKQSVDGETAVLVSGDCGFFSVARTIVRDFSDLYEIELIPGIGSVQYLSAKIKIPYDDALLVSLHARNGHIVPKVAYNKKIFALTGGTHSVREICRTLCGYGLGHVRLCVGERLSYPDEQITSATAAALLDKNFDELAVVYIENPSAADPHVPLPDSAFTRAEIPMTKEEIRWLTIQKLGIGPTDTVYDIGAGTGSVSVEMARKAFDGFVYAIDSNENACALIRENRTKHGAFNIKIVHGEAPPALDGLPVPDKAFIGGSSGNMDGILKKLTSLNPGIKIVVNAVSVQTLNQAVEGFEKYYLSGTDIVCVNIARTKRTGPYDMLTALNPVFIISGQGGGSRE